MTLTATLLPAAIAAEESGGTRNQSTPETAQVSYSANELLTAMTENQNVENTQKLQTRLLTLLEYDTPVYDAYTSISLGINRKPVAPTLLLALRTCAILEEIEARALCLIPVVRFMDHGPTIDRIVSCPVRNINDGVDCVVNGMAAQIRAAPEADQLLRPIAKDLLLEAYRANDVPLAELALDFGASANRAYVNGMPLLHKALEDANSNGYSSEMMYFLIERSDLNELNTNTGATGLMVAAKFGIAEWVMDERNLKTTGKLRINAQDQSGNTALHWLVGVHQLNGDRGLVESFFRDYDELHEKGLVDTLELNLKNHNGCRPRDYAQFDTTRKLLKKRGAKRGGVFSCKRRR